MKLKNCMIGTAVQSKTTDLTGVVIDLCYNGVDVDVDAHFNSRIDVVVHFYSYTDDGVKIVKERVKPESLRKVKSVDEMGHKERVCIIVKNSGVGVRSAVSYLNKLGYNKTALSDWCDAEVLYGNVYGGIHSSGVIDLHYKHCAHVYRDITDEVEE